MSSKKKPVLSSTYCDRIAGLQTAIEVATRKRTRFSCVDFNTGRGKVIMGEDEMKEVAFWFPRNRNDQVRFVLGERGGSWYTAIINYRSPAANCGLFVKVINEAGTGLPQWRVGTSFVDSWSMRFHVSDLRDCCTEVRKILSRILDPDGLVSSSKE